MKRWAAALVALVASACGGISVHNPLKPLPPASTTAVTPAAPQPAGAAAMVLALPDLGSGWTRIAADTRSVGLQEAITGDPVHLKRIERHAYRSGYEAMFGGENRLALQSRALVWSTRAKAQRIYAVGLRKLARATPRLRRRAAPAGTPGSGFVLFTGRIPVGSRRVRAYFGVWLHGTVIGTVLMVGRGASGSVVVNYARLEDEKIARALGR